MRKCKHGARNHQLYGTWKNMISRCTDESNPRYKDYGGRGVTVCEAWLSDPWAFFAAVGNRPSESHTIERKDNDKGYHPGNVEWATKAKQNRNRRSVRRITVGNQTLMLCEWAKVLGCDARTIAARISKGMSEQEAVTTPVDQMKRKAGCVK